MIGVGDTIRVHKGELLNGVILKRAVTAKVTWTADMSDRWVWFAPQEYKTKLTLALGGWTDFENLMTQLRYQRGEQNVFNGWSPRWGVTVDETPEVQKLLDEAKVATDAITGGDYTMLFWGNLNDGRAALRCECEKTQAKQKVEKEREITKRTFFITGSKWRVTKDITIMGWSWRPNKDHHEYEDADLRLFEDGHETKSLSAHIRAGVGENVFVFLPMYTLKAGCVITVKSKLGSPHVGINDPSARVEIDQSYLIEHTSRPKYERIDDRSGKRGMNVFYGSWGADDLCVPFNQVEELIELISAPEKTVYVLKDTATGKYFADFDYSYQLGVSTPKWATTFKSAKKYNKIANAKSSIRDWTGYNAANKSFPSDGYQPSRKKMDFLPTFVLVKMNALTYREEGLVEEDIQAWYRDLVND